MTRNLPAPDQVGASVEVGPLHPGVTPEGAEETDPEAI